MTEQFAQERLSGLGGSDAAAICGLNKYKSPLQVWREKVGLHVVEETEAMYWGTAIEPIVRTRYEKILKERYGDHAEVVPSEFFRHREHPCLIAHLDGVLVSRQNGSGPRRDTAFGILEVKTAGERMKQDWGDEWTDDIPQSYLTQVQHYLGVTELPFCHVAVLFGGREFKIFEVKSNADFIKNLFELELKFWNDHVLTQIPPEPDGSESATAMLKEMYPADTGATVEATGEVRDWAKEYQCHKGIIKQAETDADNARNHIVSFMGEAAILTGPDFRVTYKTDKERRIIDHKAAIEEIMGNPAIDPVFKSILEDHMNSHTITKAGSRRFLAKFEE